MMQGLITLKNGAVVDEVFFAVLSVVHEDEKILKHIQNSFGLSDSEYLEVKENISRYYQEPSISVELKSIKLRNLLNITGVGHGMTCLARVDGNEILTKEVEGPSPEWNVNHEFVVRDLWKSQVEVETWQEQEKETKETFARVCLRSLDLFSKKFRSTLRSENLAALSSIVSTEGNRSIPFKPKEKKSNTLEEPLKKDLHGDEERQKQRESESNWVLNAFATLRRPNSSKKTPPSGTKRPAPQPGAARHLDMLSAIPTGRDSIRDGWRAKSERSFFSKNDPNSKGKVGSQPSELANQLNRKELRDTDIKAKSEVNVRRQLFPNGLQIPPNMQEDANSKPKPRPISVFNPVYNMKPTQNDHSKNCGGETPSTPTVKKDDSQPKPNLSLRYGTLKMSPRNEFQLWKRMSLTLRDKSDSLNLESEQKAANLHSLESKQLHCSTLPREASGNGNISQVGDLSKEEPTPGNRIKVKVGLSSTRLKNVFLKMKCSEWTAEEEAVLVHSTPKKDSTPARPSTLALTLQLRCQPQPVLIPPSKVFFSCLRHFLIVEKNLQVKNDEEYGLSLPLTQESRLVLKILAFVYNIPEAQISLACWLALTQGPFLTTSGKVISSATSVMTPTYKSDQNSHEESASPGTLGREKVASENLHQNLKTSICGDYGNIHSKYLFNWLVKVEAAASCSCYTEEEEQQITSSIQSFIDSLCQQFKRIHASFPVNQSSHLAFGLRCVRLFAESRSLQSIMGKANLKMGDAWPTSNIMNAVESHAKNWSEALVSEIQSGQKKSPSTLRSPVSMAESGSGQRRVSITNPQLKPFSNLLLLQAVMNGEKAALSINDFIVLGEKIYENNFQSELNESYLEVVWPTITAALVTLLSPVQSALHSRGPKEIFNNGPDSLQDLHISLWILLLQLSKLQRFQNTREKESRPLYLPEAFSETFYLLSCLWLNICLFRAKEMVHLECQTDDLTSSENDDGLSSSARELVDLFVVIQEKLSRFSFPSDGKFKENLADFLEDGIKSVVETYKCHVCTLVLDKGPQNNALSSYMCIATNDIDRVIVEATNVVSCLFPLKEREWEPCLEMRAHTKDACFFFFTKSLPRISVWLTNALSSREKEETASDRLMDWIKSALDPVLDHSSKSGVLFQHFWDFLFNVVKEKLKGDSVPKDYRILGNFMEEVYFFYKITLHVEIHSQSQIEFQNFMEEVHLKGSPTTDVIEMYYAERYKEQEALTTRREPLVVNAYFCKDRDLKVEVFMSPYVNITPDKRRSMICSSQERRQSARSTHDRLPSISFLKDHRLTSRVKQRASGVIEWLTKSSSVSFYAKVQPVPANWFSKVKEKKTRSTQQNPPIFEDQLSFNVKCTDEGVTNGGFLLVRLKYSSMTCSGVESEGLLPLRNIAVLPFEDRRQNKHTFVKLSAPTRIQDYNSLRELTNRKQDREAISFLAHLHQSFWAAPSP